MSTILLIDDEPDILRMLALSLRADGHAVITAGSGEEGLAAFAAQAPDIVLVDIRMPGMSGLEVLRALKSTEALVEVIIVTGHGDVDNAVEALQLGASDFLNKPVEDARLAVAIQRAAEKLAIRRRLQEHTRELEEKVAEATRALKVQAQFQSRLIRSSNDGIVATDRKLRVVIFNPGAERIFGRRRSEVVQALGLAELYPPDLAAEFQAAVEAEGTAPEIPRRETVIVSQAGEEIPVHFSGAILHERGQKMGTVAFFQDLRDLKQLEQALVRKERLAAIGQTIAGVAHGIKNILHGLKGGRHLVDRGIARGDGEQLRQGWEMVKRAIDRTSDLVMDLLLYSKDRAPERVACRPNAIAAEVCELVEEKARVGGVEIVQALDPALDQVVLDQRALHTALLNLVSNAVDACLDDPDRAKRHRVVLRTRRESEDLLAFTVADNGVGMRPEIRERIFASFFTTKGHRGTGLGLMVTRKMVEEDRGSIQVESSPGEGTTVSVRWPCLPVDPA